MKTALLLIDIQNEYFPGGKMQLEGSLEASLQAKEVLALFREKRWPLFHIQHVSVRPGATSFLPGTEEVLINENVRPLPDEIVIQKNYPNAFRETSLLDHLKREQVSRVTICGLMTHMCVEAAARAACDYGFECIVLHDACATMGLSFQGQTIPAKDVHGAFLAALRSAYAKIMSVEEFLSRMRS
jgi:nicotinamidase-related amidase